MLSLTIFVCLVLNLGLGKCESVNITVTVNKINEACEVAPHYQITEGATVNLITNNQITKYINHIWVNTLQEQMLLNPDDRLHVISSNVTANMTGIWYFKYDYLKCVNGVRNGQQDDSCLNTLKSICSTNITVVPASTASKIGKWVTYVAVIGVIMVIIMIAEAIVICFYRNKVKELKQQIYLLNKTSDGAENDPDRYSTNPIKKAAKKALPPINKNRDSEIYEVPDITKGGHPFTAPLPISPRPEIGLPPLRIPPPSPTLTLRSTNSSHPTFPRPKPSDQDTLTKMSLAQRPPIPVPQDEFYSEAHEEEVYEPPPTPQNEQPNRFASHKKLGKQLPDIPVEALKPRPVPSSLKPNKPPITQPRPTPTPSRHNESKPSLPRFPESKPSLPRFPEKKLTPPKNPEPKPAPTRNVIQVPIRPIPGPSSLKKPVAKPKPPVPSPKTPPPSLEQQVKLFNDNRPIQHSESSDEEWTYEPLPQYNIYNI